MNDQTAKIIIAKSKAGYDKIAAKFSQTRRYFWPPLSFVKNYIQENDKLLDIGCGNGRFLNFIQEEKIKADYVGIDNSAELIKIAKEKYPSTPLGASPSPNFLVADATERLPFNNESFDTVVSFAVLQHIPSKKLHLYFMKEANRVLKKNGLFIFSTWNLWQKKFLPLILKNAAKKIIGLNKLDFKDIFYGFEKEQEARFLHAFTERELKKLIIKSGFKIENFKTVKIGKEESFVAVCRK